MTSIDPLLQLLAFFYIYAFLGWCVEIAFHALTTGHLVNRGMLAGPVCPIYGAGMIAMVLCTEPLQQSWLLTFLGAMVICTIIELLVGLVLRALFHTQWWDYSSEPFNIAGLICLRFSICWGFGGAFLIKVVHPPIRDAVALVPPLFLAIICCALTAVMLADLVITVRGIRHLQSQNALLFDIEAQMRETTAAIGSAIAWIFAPLGWGNWQSAVASITGLVAKENIVGTMGILFSGGDGNVYNNIAATFTAVSGYSFLAFNLLCAPCFAAMGAIKREMNNAKWTWFAIGYQCGFAYVIALIINQIGCAFTGNLHIVGLIVAIFFVAAIIYLLVRPYKEADTLKTPTAVGAR